VLSRIPIAFVFGLITYMLAMVMTTYDGALSMIFQPIVGSLLTALSLFAVLIVGSPLLIPRIWTVWRKLRWLSALLILLAIIAMALSWHPSLRVKVLNPDTNTPVESFNPPLALGGWFTLLFAICFSPLIGLSGNRRWL
jgi:hypothetical protein